MVKISYVGCLGLISSHFGAIHSWSACQPEIVKNSLKHLILGVQGHSRSSMLTFQLVASACYDKRHVCAYLQHFHVRKANNGRITLFKGVPLFLPSFMGTPSSSGMKFCHKILETLSHHTVKTRSLYLTWAPIGIGLWQTPRQNYHS